MYLANFFKTNILQNTFDTPFPLSLFAEIFFITHREIGNPYHAFILLCNDSGSVIITKKKNPWLVFPCEFRESFRNNYSTEQFWHAASTFDICYISTFWIILSSVYWYIHSMKEISDHSITQKMNSPIKDFFSKYVQISTEWSYISTNLQLKAVLFKHTWPFSAGSVIFT